MTILTKSALRRMKKDELIDLVRELQEDATKVSQLEEAVADLLYEDECRDAGRVVDCRPDGLYPTVVVELPNTTYGRASLSFRPGTEVKIG